MDFLNSLFISDSGGEPPVVQRAELEADGPIFADYEHKTTIPCYCVVA